VNAWLALDTATDSASVAVGVPPATAAAVAIAGSRRQAADIIPAVDDTLRRAAVSRDQLSGIVVADGPGSFTGLRIGWAVAKSLSHERDLPIVAFPALLAAAVGAAEQAGDGVVAACFDALRGQIFAAVYRIGPTAIDAIVVPVVVTPAELIDRVADRPRVVVGDGAVRFAGVMREWSGAAPLPLDALAPGAASLLRLAAREGAGRRITTSDEPVYGRPAEAQVKWEARHGRPLPDPTGHAS
jgi:tRNA threonylcarbamoyladenosine biosynthesis protein TsaB